MTARRKHPEEDLQCQMVAYLRRAMPDDVAWTAVESSGRGARDGARQKAKGVNPGWCDLQFLKPPHGTYLGLEVKTEADGVRGVKRTGLSPVQKARKAQIEAVGGIYEVVRSVPDLDASLRRHGFDLKARSV